MRRVKIGKGIMATAEKDQVCTDTVTMPESQMLEAEEERGGGAVRKRTVL